MKRWLYLSRTIDRTPATWPAIVDGAERALIADGASLKRPDGSFTVQLPKDGGAPLNPGLLISLGATAQRPDGRSVLPIRFEASAADVLFPVFEGTVEFEAWSGTVGRLSLVGSYVPPLGPLGAAIDSAVLHRVAESTAQVLLDRLLAPTVDTPARLATSTVSAT